MVDEGHPRRARGGAADRGGLCGLQRGQGVEERQGNDRAHASEECAAGDIAGCLAGIHDYKRLVERLLSEATSRKGANSLATAVIMAEKV